MLDDRGTKFTPSELKDLRRLAGFMVPPSQEFRVPGADDAMIFADIVRSIGRDHGQVRAALAMLGEMAGGDFAGLEDAAAQTKAMELLKRGGAAATALGRAVLQCYYRDDRVIAALGLDPRPPFPQGHVLEQGDWSLLDVVKGRPRMWRDVDGKGS